MNKNDWMEYFATVNGRTPSEEEISAALANNEFTEGENLVQEQVVAENIAPLQEQVVAENVAPVQEQVAAEKIVPLEEKVENQAAGGNPNFDATQNVAPNFSPAPNTPSQFMVFFDKVKQFVLGHKKLVLGAVAVLVAALVAWNFFESQPKSVLAPLKVEFKGYDGDGTLDYNAQDIHKEVMKVTLKKSGFNQKQIEGIINGDGVTMANLQIDSKLRAQYDRAMMMMSDVSYSFDKTSGLKNDQTVVMTVKTKSKESPVKSETKKFTVKGLKKIEKISSEEFLKEYPVTFKGFNGYGSVELPEDEDGNTLLMDDNERSHSYKNGDTVKLAVSSYYLDSLKEEGKKLESDTIEVKVSGLKEITEISNLSQAIPKNDTYAKSEHENDNYNTYTLEKQKDFIAYNTAYSDNASGQIYIVTVYKVTHVSKFLGDPKTTVTYRYYGYRYYVNEDNSLDLETANKISGYGTQDKEKLLAELDTDGYKEYTAKK